MICERKEAGIIRHKRFTWTTLEKTKEHLFKIALLEYFLKEWKLQDFVCHLTPQFPEHEPRLTNESKLASVITVHKLQLKVVSLIKIQINNFLLDTNSYLYRCTISVRTCEPFSLSRICSFPRFYCGDFFVSFVLRHWRVLQVFTPRISLKS